MSKSTYPLKLPASVKRAATRLARRASSPQAHRVSEDAPTHAAPMASPDGRWIAYPSTEAGGGSFDVYVHPFPGPGGMLRVSTDGGTDPRWSTTTHELLYLNLQGNVMVASYALAGDSFRAGKLQLWSPVSTLPGSRVVTNSAYDVHPDGKRIAAAARCRRQSGQSRVRLQLRRLPAQDRAGDQVAQRLRGDKEERPPTAARVRYRKCRPSRIRVKRSSEPRRSPVRVVSITSEYIACAQSAP
jgi:hypothetical protein